MTPPKIMIVLGAGRSCTSGIARALHFGGWPMSAHRMIGATAANPYGHYECTELVALNERILEKHGGSYYNPPVISYEIAHLDIRLFDDTIKYIGSRIDAHGGGQWGIKDPRLGVCWPYWEHALSLWSEIEPIRVTANRDLATAAASLAKRDGVDPVRAQQITEEHQAAAAIAATRSIQ